ncbi:hypothetical protein RHGRI_003747 [Rhododendron griersonianum]|nr:hypothetical protein RHGRI_003747 [Rhododendron griersonianum]
MQSTSRRKRQKLSEEVKLNEAEDRISNLPKNLIGHILSFLPTKYAVRTGILSTKWKWMWTSISNLDFDDQLFLHSSANRNSDYREMSFLKFVYRVLLLLEGSNINKFRITCSQVSDVSYVNSWVTAALLRNVRELDLCLPLGSSVLIPTNLFSCDKLEVLKLGSGFVLNIPSLVDLKSLKTLHLSLVEFMDEESIKRLLSSCPVLEVFALFQCGGKNVSVINISAPALKRLIVEYPAPKCWETSLDEIGITDTQDVCPYEIQLNTPNLLYFAYMGLVAEGFAMNNLSSLVEASIDFELCYDQVEDRYDTAMTELLHGISNVQTLHLSGDCIETLQFYIGPRLQVFRCLTTLELSVKIPAQWELLPNLLECSPNLRTLGFKGLMEEYYEPGKFQGWYPPKRVPTCLLVTLEKIKIGRFRGQETELEVVDYFLTYAKVLKIMDIWFDRYQRRQILSEYEVLRKLLEIPRGSTSCKVRVTCQAKKKGG